MFSKLKAFQQDHKDITYYMVANIIFSVSTFAVNICLPYILEYSFFNEFIYVFQMVLFMTTVMQMGIVIGLYRFIEKSRDNIFNVYYTIILFVNFLLLFLGLITPNFISGLLKLDSLSKTEHLMFFLSIIVSGIFLYNKGKNIADKAYGYMMKVALVAFSMRLLIVLILGFFNMTSLSVTLFLVFILPFVQDIKDYVKNSFRYIRLNELDLDLLKTFSIYSLKVWIIGTLFIVSDRIFLIYTKDIDIQLTTAIAFSSGFLGIISLFNASFNNYFLSNLSSERIKEVSNYTKKLKRLLFPYVGLLLMICLFFSGLIYVIYPTLGSISAIILFITLLRSGLISYLGMFSLLTKVLDLLNLEIILNICRIIVVYSLCTLWHPQNLILWYTVVIFTIPLPELALAIIINYRIKRQCQLVKE